MLEITIFKRMSIRAFDRFSGKILLISSKAGGKVLLINVGIEVCGTIPDGFAIKNKNFEQISC